MNELVYAVLLSALAGSAAAQAPCGATTGRESAGRRYAQTLTQPEAAAFRAQEPRIETVPDTTTPVVVSEPRECARLQRPIRDAIRQIYPDGKTRLEDFSHTIFRVGPYYLVYLGVHESLQADQSIDTVQPLLIIRASDLAYLRYLMVR